MLSELAFSGPPAEAGGVSPSFFLYPTPGCASYCSTNRSEACSLSCPTSLSCKNNWCGTTSFILFLRFGRTGGTVHGRHAAPVPRRACFPSSRTTSELTGVLVIAGGKCSSCAHSPHWPKISEQPLAQHRWRGAPCVPRSFFCRASSLLHYFYSLASRLWPCSSTHTPVREFCLYPGGAPFAWFGFLSLLAPDHLLARVYVVDCPPRRV